VGIRAFQNSMQKLRTIFEQDILEKCGIGPDLYAPMRRERPRCAESQCRITFVPGEQVTVCASAELSCIFQIKRIRQTIFQLVNTTAIMYTPLIVEKYLKLILLAPNFLTSTFSKAFLS